MLRAMASSTEQAESQNRRGHIALKEMKKYTALLEDALTNGHVSLDCDGGEGSGGVVPAISCLVLPRRWALFMKKVCDCFTMVKKLIIHLAACSNISARNRRAF